MNVRRGLESETGVCQGVLLPQGALLEGTCRRFSKGFCVEIRKRCRNSGKCSVIHQQSADVGDGERCGYGYADRDFLLFHQDDSFPKISALIAGSVTSRLVSTNSAIGVVLYTLTVAM